MKRQANSAGHVAAHTALSLRLAAQLDHLFDLGNLMLDGVEGRMIRAELGTQLRQRGQQFASRLFELRVFGVLARSLTGLVVVDNAADGPPIISKREAHSS